MSYTDGTLLKGNNPEIYVMEAGLRRLISNPIIFILREYDWNRINFLSDQELNTIPLGEPINADDTLPVWREADRLLQTRKLTGCL